MRTGTPKMRALLTTLNARGLFCFLKKGVPTFPVEVRCQNEPLYLARPRRKAPASVAAVRRCARKSHLSGGGRF